MQPLLHSPPRRHTTTTAGSSAPRLSGRPARAEPEVEPEVGVDESILQTSAKWIHSGSQAFRSARGAIGAKFENFSYYFDILHKLKAPPNNLIIKQIIWQRSSPFKLEISPNVAAALFVIRFSCAGFAHPERGLGSFRCLTLQLIGWRPRPDFEICAGHLYIKSQKETVRQIWGPIRA